VVVVGVKAAVTPAVKPLAVKAMLLVSPLRETVTVTFAVPA
jgi:hypothetical protein